MGNKIALCIGINNYPGTQNDLNGCVNDANDWAKLLRSKGFSVQKLINNKATRSGMLAAIKGNIAKAVSGDTVIFTYSGHGSFVPDENGDEPSGTDECLCPYDIDSKGPLVDDELFDLYNTKARGVKLVIISDSCHSGTVARMLNFSLPRMVRGRGTPIRKVRFLPPATFLSKKDLGKLGIRSHIRSLSVPGKYAGLLLAACQDSEYSYDTAFNGRPNGAFSYVALETLGKLHKNASFNDWYKAICKILPSQEYPQKPNLFGSPSMKKWKIFL